MNRRYVHGFLQLVIIRHQLSPSFYGNELLREKGRSAQGPQTNTLTGEGR
jgi:hypothetical protein